jgi:ATP-dependent RNA helicase DOB1
VAYFFPANCDAELGELEEKRANMTISDEGTIREYYDLKTQLDQFSDDVRTVISHPKYSVPYLTPGRLLNIKYKDFDFGWGVVVNCKKRKPAKNSEEISDHQSWVVDVLLKVADGPSVGTKTFGDLPPGVRPPKEGEGFQMAVVPLLLNCIQSISHVRLHLPKDVQSAGSREVVRKKVDEVKKRFPDGIAVLDPIEDMGIKDDEFKKLLRVSGVCSRGSRQDANKP